VIVRRLRANAFLAGRVGAIALASAAPSIGRSGGPLHGELLADAGIFLVFLHGLRLVVLAILGALMSRRAEPGGDVHAPLTRRPGN
jgi:sodium/bile acid cotransporter 7